MDKTTLTDLKKKVLIRTALISLGNLEDLLGLNDYLSPDEILLEIFKKALKEFELTCPLILEMPISTEQVRSCTAPNGFFEIKSNFTLYLKCIIPEQRIILVPNSLPQWRIATRGAFSDPYNSYGGYGVLPQPLAYEYAVDYRRPYVCLNPGILNRMTDGDIVLRGICSRPIIPDFLPDKSFNSASENSAIYWMDVENGGARENYFMDLVVVHVLDFIRQLKASISLVNIPIDVLGNVDTAYMELRSRCDSFAATSGWYGELLV